MKSDKPANDTHTRARVHVYSNKMFCAAGNKDSINFSSDITAGDSGKTDYVTHMHTDTCTPSLNLSWIYTEVQ